MIIVGESLKFLKKTPSSFHVYIKFELAMQLHKFKFEGMKYLLKFLSYMEKQLRTVIKKNILYKIVIPL